MVKNSPDKPKSQISNKVQTPKKQMVQTPKKQMSPPKPKQSTNNGVTKAKKIKSPPKPKLHLIPDNFCDSLSRRQKKRAIFKLVRQLKYQGTEDISTVNPNDASYIEIFSKILTKTNDEKSQKTPGKQVKTPNKAKIPSKPKTPKKTPNPKSE